MDENNIQILRENLTEEYHNLAKSHTAAIEQLLEEFNDDQMMFRLEAEAYEQECLADMNNSASTTDDHKPEPTTNTTEPVDTHITPEPTTMTTTLPKPEPTEDGPREDKAIPDPAIKPPSPTPLSEQPEQIHAPEDILDILEEEKNKPVSPLSIGQFCNFWQNSFVSYSIL